MIRPLPANTRITAAAAVVETLNDPRCLLALLERLPPVDLAAYLRGRQFSDCHAIDITLPCGTTAATLETLLTDAGYPRHAGRRALAADIAALMAVVGTLPLTRQIRLRLERVTTDACRLFHTDTLPLRLVCTYRGAGTDWLDEDACDRNGLGKGDNSGICRDRDGIHRMPEYWAGLMKGNLWPGQQGPLPGGLVHRSPPQYPGEWRLFLSLDALPA